MRLSHRLIVKTFLLLIVLIPSHGFCFGDETCPGGSCEQFCCNDPRHQLCLDYCHELIKSIFGIMTNTMSNIIKNVGEDSGSHSPSGPNSSTAAKSEKDRALINYSTTTTSRTIQPVRTVQTPQKLDAPLLKKHIPLDNDPTSIGWDPLQDFGGPQVPLVPTDKSGIPLKAESNPTMTNGNRISFYYEHFFAGTSSRLTLSLNSDPRVVHFNLQDNSLNIPSVAAKEKLTKEPDDEGYGATKLIITIDDPATGSRRIIEYHGADLPDFKLNLEVPDKTRVAIDPGVGCDQSIQINGAPYC